MNYQEFNEILWDDNEDYESVTSTKIEDQSRWSVYKSCVFKQKSTGKFFEEYWGKGSTEYQEDQCEVWSFTQVAHIEVNVIEYSNVKNGIKYEGNSDDS